MRIKLHKSYITPLILGLATLSLIIFLIMPLLLGIRNDSKEFINIRNSTVDLKTQNNEIKTFKTDYESYKSNLEKMNGFFINPESPVGFIKFLEEESRNAGIKSKISLLSDSRTKDQGVITFQVFSSDDFLKIMNFMERLENSPYVLGACQRLIFLKNPPLAGLMLLC